MKLFHYINSDRAVYSDLNPRDGGQSLYPMCTVYVLDWVISVRIKILSEVNKYIHVFSNEINVVEKIYLF